MSARHWTQAETDRAIALWKSGKKVLEISYLVGRSWRGTAHKLRMCRDQGLIEVRKRHAIWTPELDAEILRLWETGIGGTKIAAQVGVSQRQVYNRLGKLRGVVGHKQAHYKAERRVRFADVRAVVLAEYQTSMDELTAGGRKLQHIEPRQVLMCVGYRYTGLSLPQIGQRFGRDHTTVLHAVKVAPRKYPQAVAGIEAKLFHREAAE